MDENMVSNSGCYWNMVLVEGSGQWRNSYGEIHLSKPRVRDGWLFGIGRTS